MILHHFQIVFQVNEFNKKTSELQNLSLYPDGHPDGPPLGQIQKIFSTTRYICLSVRYPGLTRYLYLGRGGGFEGIWEGTTYPPSEIRIKDRFLDYLRKHLTAANLMPIEVDTHDRIVILSSMKGGQVSRMAFFWNGRPLYFVNDSYDYDKGKRYLFLSWHKKPEEIPSSLSTSELLDLFDSIGRIRDKEASSIYDRHRKLSSIEELLQDEMKLKGSSPQNSKDLKFLEKKEKKIQDDLVRNQKWAQLEEAIQMNPEELMDTLEWKKWGQTFKFHKDWNLYRRIDVVYDKIKRLKLGEKILTERLIDTQTKIKESQGPKRPPSGAQIVLKAIQRGRPSQQQAASKFRAIRPVWYNSKEPAGSLKVVEEDFGSDILQVNLPGKVRGLFGKTDKANDHIRSKIAKDEDMWAHLDGPKSAHAFLKFHSTADLTPDLFNLVGTILAELSHFSATRIPIIYTQVKNLKSVKGVPGLVTYRKQKHLLVEKVDSWRETLEKDA